MDKQMDDNAERMLKEILEINPRIINVYNSLGIIYRRQHKYDKAVAQYKKALKVSPNDESILYNLGRIYFETDHLGQAEEAITKALEQSPQFGEAKEMLRQIKKRRGVKGRKSSSSAGNGKLVLASRQHGDIKAN